MDKKNDIGQTWLHYAASFNNATSIKYLKNLSDHLNFKDRNGKYPIDFASDEKAKELLKIEEEYSALK